MAVVLADTNSFDALINTDFTVVDFCAYHCSVCVVLAPNYNEVSNEYPLVNFIKVNVDDVQAFSYHRPAHGNMLPGWQGGLSNRLWPPHQREHEGDFEQAPVWEERPQPLRQGLRHTL